LSTFRCDHQQPGREDPGNEVGYEVFSNGDVNVRWNTVYTILIFKFANHRTKEFFLSTANEPLVGALMTIGDVTLSIAIA